MRTEDALRKIVLLRRMSTDNGVTGAEAETAAHLQKVLMERYAISSRNVSAASRPNVSSLTWVYWEELLHEFGLRLDHFGHRGSAAVGSNKKVHIRLDKNQWWVEQKSPSGWQTTARNCGVELLRKYLSEHAPRTYSLLKR
jgi:hypothetical protein